MGKKIVIIGAVALGPKVACRLRRLDAEAEITLLDRDDLISYGGCGIPYYLSGDINELEDLRSTAAHLLRDSDFFQASKGIRVLTRVEATAIDRRVKQLEVRHLDSGKTERLAYDKLVMATGARPFRPPIPGAGLPGVYTISDLHAARSVKELMTTGKVGRALVIGGGAIGLEIAEAMVDLWGIETALVEMEDQVLPTLLGKCIARVVQQELVGKGVKLLLSTRVLAITRAPDGVGLLVETSAGLVESDLVILAAGVRPTAELAVDAGLAIGATGGILVDRRMRTSDPNIYAGGDCVELSNLVSGENGLMALGSLANRQGRVIADNLAGGQSIFHGTVGTFCLKVFGMAVAKAGLTYRQATESGFDPVYGVVSQSDHAHFYPGAEMMHLSLLADRRSRRVLGIEAAGRNGDGVKGRVDAVAVLLRGGLLVDDVCGLETAYAPPFASAMDAINNAGNVVDNILCGRNRPIDAADFLYLWQHRQITVLDVRGEREAAPFIARFGRRWQNIPQNQLRYRIPEIPRDVELFLLCDTGPRSYEAQVFLDGLGISTTRNIQGGYAMIKAIDPDFLSADLPITT